MAAHGDASARGRDRAHAMARLARGARWTVAGGTPAAAFGAAPSGGDSGTWTVGTMVENRRGTSVLTGSRSRGIDGKRGPSTDRRRMAAVFS
jgi:hypothetical protein